MKKTAPLLFSLTLMVIVLTLNSCAHDRRWYSTYKDRDGDKKREHYNGYTRKWYKKHWNNRGDGTIWK